MSLKNDLLLASEVQVMGKDFRKSSAMHRGVNSAERLAERLRRGASLRTERWNETGSNGKRITP